MQYTNVTAEAKANIYFDGNVVSHKITMADDTTKTLGVMFAGEYHFATEKAERMEISDGTCQVTLDGTTTTKEYSAGEHFDVEANAGFTIKVSEGVAQYVCSYID